MVARFHPSDAQAPEPDNPRAEQRRGMQIIDTAGQWEDEIGARHRVFRVPAVYRVSRKGGRIAEVFEIAAAIWTSTVHAPYPGHADACAHREMASGARDNFADDLMARDHRRTNR